MKGRMLIIFSSVMVCLFTAAFFTTPSYPAPAPVIEEFQRDSEPYAKIGFAYCYHWDVTNKEGQKLALIYDPEDEKGSMKPKGTMEYTNLEMYMGGVGGPAPGDCDVPFSERFTFSLPWELDFTNRPRWGEFTREYCSYFDVTFFDGRKRARQWVSNFCGTIVYHRDDVIELFGNVGDVKATFHDYSQDIEWTACGSGGLYAKFSLVGDEVIAEGMTGGYTVTKYDCDEYYMELYTKAYDENGKEIPYVPPEDEAL